MTVSTKIHFGRLFYVFVHTYVLSEGLIMTTFDSNHCTSFEDDDIDIGLSYQQCIQQCNNLNGCLSVSFKQTVSECRMHFQENNLNECNGFVHSRKAEWLEIINDGCRCLGKRSCVATYTCTEERCSDVPAPSQGKRYGNKRRRHDKIVTVCNKGYILIGTQQRECLDGSWSGDAAQCEKDPNCNQYLVSGPNAVEDSQLSESSYWCGIHIIHDPKCVEDRTRMSAVTSRLDMTGHYTGGWSAAEETNTEYIQVDFLTLRQISAVVIQGRDPAGLNIVEYVTEFKVKISDDCTTFTAITDENGNEQLFQGSTNSNDKVIVVLPDIVTTRCVRINPQAWYSYPSLRFDILGC